MKLSREEKSWILYDVGNSAFTLLITTIVPIYFNYLANNAQISATDYLAYWGYAASVATILVALMGPIAGTMADMNGFKKIFFMISMFVGAAGCILLGLARQWLVFLVIFVIAKIGFSASLIFYDAMLTDVTDEKRMDQVSAQGYAWGYIGSCIPFIICLILVLGADKIGLTIDAAMAVSFVIVSLWWVVMSLPLLKNYKQKYYVQKSRHAVGESFRRIGKTLMNVGKEKKIFLFLLAFFFYIDGVYTIIDMATAYGSALGLDSTGLLLALLATQIVAFPSAIIFGRLAKSVQTSRLILVCITAYIGISVFAIFLTTQMQFWVLAVLVGMFQGGIQALSRSYFAKIIPAEQSGEYFGLMDICGKGAAFMGTTVVGAATQLTGSMNKGVATISILFVAGLVLFAISSKLEK
ncbi:MAG: MFS transporter [Lachnospiraceae bacterium]